MVRNSPNLLARDLTDASHDLHFTVEYTRNVFPDFSKPPPPEVQARYQDAMAQGNCGFEKVEIRPHNVGYLKLNSFSDAAVCLTKAESTMKALNRVDALIFDLRDNRGGNGNMAVFLAGFLFDHPEYMFNAREPVTEQNWTRSPIAGSLLVNNPVYTLFNLNHLPLGFESDHILIFRLRPPRARYTDPQMTTFFKQLEERLASLPGVRSVAAGNIGIIGDGHSGSTFHVMGRPREKDPAFAQINAIGTDFFETLGIPIL